MSLKINLHQTNKWWKSECKYTPMLGPYIKHKFNIFEKSILFIKMQDKNVFNDK